MENILTRLRGNELINITESSHYIKRVKRDYCGSELSYNILKKSIPLYIKSPINSKFRVTYSHPDTSKYNLVIVIFIIDLDNIKLITTFPESKSKIEGGL
ncbi:hypothetical protein MBCUT_16820 [Methanobrevibacter cuticularis]|uniref:Phage-Barnase-EndoU-ColicinE5/D-RelE like nuclease 3 domain-containing protein n=1 Tax=Methanobrevibacter cuticularis TaxID=47311 RepID=A0A166D5A9_9EURY|nr:hypothetical protein [Methanobrevibacter cuticularis]KZX15222.1 hypothetical protein MBCUT_16820 [Methanobrevibacter cuticularis]